MPTARRGGINRFVVMAMLQAARAERLGLSASAARSWGLNRAIFYAAAKRGFRGQHGVAGEGEAPTHPSTETFHLGDELAYRDPEGSQLRFTIGGKVQTDEDFDRQIASRFGSSDRYRRAWDECEKVVGQYDKQTLGSRSEFYSTVYKPRRDQLVDEWSGWLGSTKASTP